MHKKCVFLFGNTKFMCIFAVVITTVIAKVINKIKRYGICKKNRHETYA